jgi:ethanolaminephosphotransferase
MSIATMILSGIYGPQIWKAPLSSYLPVQGISFLENISLVEFLLAIMVVLALLTQIPTSIIHTWKATAKSEKSRVESILNLVPYGLMVYSCFVWVTEPNSVVYEYLFPFLISFGLCSAKIIV